MAGRLQHSPADVVGKLLTDLGLGTDPEANVAWPLSVTGELTTPDECIEVYDTTGRLEGSLQVNGEMLVKPGIMIRVRAADHLSGYRKANQLFEAIAKTVYHNEVILPNDEEDDITYLVEAITPTSDVLPLGKEVPSSKRDLFTINAVVALRQTNP